MDKNKTIRPIDANSFCHDDFKLCTDEDECMEVVESKPTLTSEYEIMWNELKIALDTARDRIISPDTNLTEVLKDITAVVYNTILKLMSQMEVDHGLSLEEEYKDEEDETV